MLKKDIVITLDNDQEFGITDVEFINGIEYVLMIHLVNQNELKICKIILEEEGIAVVEIDSHDLKNVYPVFYDKAKIYLKNFMN